MKNSLTVTILLQTDNMFRSIIKRMPVTGARFLVILARPTVSFTPFMKFHAPITSTITMPTVSKIMPTISTEMEALTTETEDNTMYMDSVMRKRRLKMKKHKLRKRRREQRSLKKRLGKI